MNKKILIACPVQNREWILDHYLQHIYNIDYPKHLISLYFIINNTNDNSREKLQDFKDKHQSEYSHITIEIDNCDINFKDNRSMKTRMEHTYTWLSHLRNKIIRQCVKRNHDYLLSCDSDILVPSNIIKKLLSHNKPLVASLIFNGYLFTPPNAPEGYDPIHEAYRYTNILKKKSLDKYIHIQSEDIKNPQLVEDSKLLEVDFTGAVFLASKEVCDAGRYSWHIQGEDEPFSRTVKNKGYKLYCDVSCYSQHMMSQDILDLYLNGDLCFENGDVVKIY